MSSSASTEDPSKLLPALQHAASGSLGTLISTCALYPLSLVITRLQVQRQLLRDGKPTPPQPGSREVPDPAATSATSATAPPSAEDQGPASATSASEARAAAAAARATTPNATQAAPSPPHSPSGRSAAQIDRSHYDGIVDAFSKICAEEGGPKALYSGLVSSSPGVYRAPFSRRSSAP
ncbi:hypothetical protein DL765_010549 [Monosporascus sp. GIB2]|nr:hypothetical protein DL765_010549 [Monosporascus sp. GIB2]